MELCTTQTSSINNKLNLYRESFIAEKQVSSNNEGVYWVYAGEAAERAHLKWLL